jgi:hypothetical protein
VTESLSGESLIHWISRTDSGVECVPRLGRRANSRSRGAEAFGRSGSMVSSTVTSTSPGDATSAGGTSQLSPRLEPKFVFSGPPVPQEPRRLASVRCRPRPAPRSRSAARETPRRPGTPSGTRAIYRARRASPSLRTSRPSGDPGGGFLRQPPRSGTAARTAPKPPHSMRTSPSASVESGASPACGRPRALPAAEDEARYLEREELAHRVARNGAQRTRWRRADGGVVKITVSAPAAGARAPPSPTAFQR